MIVENAFGILKGRFKSLHCELRIKLDVVPNYIVALAVLHNLAIEWGDVQLMYDTGDPGVQPDEVEIGVTGSETRRNIMESCFGYQYK